MLSIGILGGVGAIASARFHLDLVTRWAKQHDARTDDDFPRIVHSSQSLALGPEGLVHRGDTTVALLAALLPLVTCDRIMVICNSVTEMLPWSLGCMEDKLWTPVEACAEVLCDIESAWLLASDSTIRDGIYQRAYPHVEWKVPAISMTPLIQQSLSSGHIDFALDIPAGDTIVLGCTELSTARLKRPNTISPTDEMIRILCNT